MVFEQGGEEFGRCGACRQRVVSVVAVLVLVAGGDPPFALLLTTGASVRHLTIAITAVAPGRSLAGSEPVFAGLTVCLVDTLTEYAERMWRGEATMRGLFAEAAPMGVAAPVADGVAVVPGFANVIVFQTTDGLVLVDTGLQQTAQTMFDAVRASARYLP